MQSFSPLDCLVSWRSIARDGTVSWVAAIADTINGRVQIRRIGSDRIECNLSRRLMKSLLDRGDIVRGARRVWRHAGEELATIAATLLAPLCAGERGRSEVLVLEALADISVANVTAWAHSFGIERCDVEDLVMTVDDVRDRMDRVPASIERTTAVIAAMRSNIGGPAGDPAVLAAMDGLAELERRLARINQASNVTRSRSEPSDLAPRRAASAA